MTAEYKTKEYHRQKSREHYLKYKKSYNKRSQQEHDKLMELCREMKAPGCLKCSEKEPAALDFHHIKGKDMLISQMRGRNRDKILEEIAKCVILCANCHRKVHAGLITL